MKEAKQALNGFYDLFNRLNEPSRSSGGDRDALQATVERTRKSFAQAMDDDLNTSAALAAFQGLRSDVNKLLGHGLSAEDQRRVREEFRALGNNLGLFQCDRWDFNVRIEPKPAHLVLATFAPTVTIEAPMTNAQIEARLAERIEAKARKDYKQADTIREELRSLGITIEDKPDGTSRWKR